MARRIAVVEDDAAIRANYAEAIKRHGYEVATYGDRREATEALRNRLPDLAIIDIGLGDEAEGDRKSTRLNSSHIQKSRMPSSA